MADVKKNQSNNKLLEKVMAANYRTKETKNIEVSCTNNVHIGQKDFWSCYFWKFLSGFFSSRVKKLEVYFSLYEYF